MKKWNWQRADIQFLLTVTLHSQRADDLPTVCLHFCKRCQSPIKPSKLAKKHIGGFTARRPTYVCGQMDDQMPN